MKKIITFSILCSVCLFIQAEYIEIKIKAGELKNSLTEEQMQSVERLTITGSMNAEDLAVIQNYMPKLIGLDLENVELDTIPAKAFYGNKSLQDIWSPIHIEYIGDQAFDETEIQLIITGQFPRFGEKVFGDNELYIDLYYSNDYCEVIFPYIYSKDGKILHYVYPYHLGQSGSILEGTEIIAGQALSYTEIRHIEFPSSLKKIEKHAFINTKVLPMYARYHHPNAPTRLDFYSETPPILEEGVFTENNIFRDEFYIRVPKGCRNIYKEADPQWSVFRTILEEGEVDPGDYISITTKSSLSITKDKDAWTLSNEKGIARIEVFNSLGSLIHLQDCNDTKVCIQRNDKVDMPNYVKVIYTDDTFETIKLIK